jgi:hypothetical protein
MVKSHRSFKYLITMSMEWIDYDPGSYRSFSIEYETTDLEEANRTLHKIKREKLDKAMQEHRYHELTDREVYEIGPRKKGKVLRSESCAIGLLAYEEMTFTFDLIQIPKEQDVDKDMFHSKDDEWNEEVECFFDSRP